MVKLTHLGVLARRLGMFSLVILISAVGATLSMYLVVSEVGLSTWSRIALGQLVGQFGVVIVLWGWPLTATVEVARANVATVRAMARTSLAARLSLLALTAPILLILSTVAVGEADMAVWTVALGYAGQGLTLTWLFVGLSDSAGVLWMDAVPRVTFLLLGSLGVGEFGVLWFGVCVMIGSVLAVALSLLRVGARTGRCAVVGVVDANTSIVSNLRSRSTGVRSDLYSTAYLVIPVVIAPALTGASLVALLAVDRTQKLLKNAAWPVVQVCQGLLLPLAVETQPWDLARTTAKRFLLLGGVSAVVGGAILVVAVPLVTAGSVRAEFELIVPYSVALGAAVAGMGIAFVSLPLVDGQGDVSRATLPAAVVALGALYPALLVAAGSGLAILVALCEIIAVGGLLIALARNVRRCGRMTLRNEGGGRLA